MGGTNKDVASAASAAPSPPVASAPVVPPSRRRVAGAGTSTGAHSTADANSVPALAQQLFHFGVGGALFRGAEVIIRLAKGGASSCEEQGSSDVNQPLAGRHMQGGC